ncbi:MAG: zinc ABC transporter substrate-binding protein [Theionarchaea archaeon]|nr:zinc ABC transporter substrate-binding protein [Theionarchaea archaeon]
MNLNVKWNRNLIGILFMVMALSGAGCVPCMSQDTVTIISSTTTLGSLAEEVGGDHVTVISLVQPGVCPSHFDIRPSHVAEVEQAKLILFHGIEPWLEDLITASGNEDIIRVNLNGPWNTPVLAQAKIEIIRDALITVDPENTSDYEKNAGNAIETLNETSEIIKAEISQYNVSEIPVLCMDWQVSSVEWMGGSIVGSYGPPETLSVKDIDELISIGKDQQALMVIDNLQSGTDVGAQIAAAIGAEHVVFSNYPSAVPGTETVVQMITYNARQFIDAVQKIQTEAEEISQLETQLEKSKEKTQIYGVLAAVFFIVSAVEAVLLYVRKK